MDQLAQKTVSYFYDEEYANHSLGGCNPMRPHRVRLTNRLLEGYNMTSRMQVHRPRALDYEGLNYFHADEYLSFLSKVTPNNQREYKDQVSRFNLGAAGEADCPVFDGMYEYCQLYAGGSRDGALYLMEGKAEIAFNWAGGMHHAKRAEASGFCYVNDIVLSILELLKHYHRVLYVDIDIHHGDGVEEAFYLTDRVMTVSFHKYGDNFFPGTGACGDVGYAKGAGYSVNVPLKDGMDDESYKFIFEPVMKKVLEVFQPEAIAVCAGADSLSGDRLGCFNLSLEGHSNCLEFLALHNVPILILGGGGYTMRNVSRCWTYETARLQGVDLPDEIPEDTMKMHAFYKDTGRLRIDVSNMYNTNTRNDLETLRAEILQNLDSLRKPSGVAIAPQPAPARLPDAPEEDPDIRGGGKLLDELNVKTEGFEAGEEATAGRVPDRPPPANDPSPEIDSNKIESEVKKDDAAVKPEPMEALNPSHNGGAEQVQVRAAEGGAATGVVEAQAAAPLSPAPAAAAPVQLARLPLATSPGFAALAQGQLQAPHGLPAAPAASSPMLPGVPGMPAALSGMPAAMIPGGVPVVAPGAVSPPAVMVQPAAVAPPVTQAIALGLQNHAPFMAADPAVAPQNPHNPPPPAPAPAQPGQAPGGGAFR